MKLRVGYELVYECPQPTPMMLMLNTHFSHAQEVLRARCAGGRSAGADPAVPRWLRQSVQPHRRAGRGAFRCRRRRCWKSAASSRRARTTAASIPVEDLPDECLVFLLGSRYCETDLLSDIAWQLFAKTPARQRPRAGDLRLRARHITFGYHHARPTKTAWQAHQERHGVCRDFAHLADHAVPRDEHSGALLHGLYQRCRLAAAVRSDGFRRVVRSVRRRHAGRPSIRATTRRVSAAC